MSYNAKNYTEQGGDVTHVGGTLVFDDGGKLKGGLMPNRDNSYDGSDSVAKVRATLGRLFADLKNAGLMVADAFTASVKACPTPSAMPTTETKNNSAKATVSISGTDITIALNCEVDDLEDADHGATWGEHKWIGFGVGTGFSAGLTGITFTDDTGASVELSSADDSEASALGLDSGDFVLYIKAEDPNYLTGDKYFILSADGYEDTKFTMTITETHSA